MKNLKVRRYDYDKKKLNGNVFNDIKTEQKCSELFLKITTLKLLENYWLFQKCQTKLAAVIRNTLCHSYFSNSFPIILENRDQSIMIY